MSAQLGLSGENENPVKLEASHSTVCKFGSTEKDKNNLKLVTGNIRDLYRGALKKSESLTNDPDEILQKRMLALPLA